MNDRFDFNDRRLLLWCAVVVVVVAPLCYFFEAWEIALALGFGAMMFSAQRSRERVLPGAWIRQSFIYPEPTQGEGSIAAIGMALWVAAAISYVAYRIHPWTL